MTGRALLSLLLVTPAALAAPTLTIVSSVDGAAPTPASKRIRLGQTVTLQVAQTDVTDLRWFRLEPAALALDNTQPSFHYAEIPYREVEVIACRGARGCVADVRASDAALHGGVDGVGTMAFRVRGRRADGVVVASPGVERRVRGGLSPEVHRVTVRRDDTYLGMLTELMQLPYVFGSDGPPGQHQADLLIGSDCADLAVYGLRRLGRGIPYVSTWTLDRHVRESVRAVESRDGVAHTARGTPVRIGADGVRPGDLLLFPGTRHVGVLYEDRAPLGLLDEGDLMLHTCWAPPRVEPLRDTACASFPIRVLSTRALTTAVSGRRLEAPARRAEPTSTRAEPTPVRAEPVSTRAEAVSTSVEAAGVR